MSDVIDVSLDRIDECRYKPPKHFPKDRVEKLRKLFQEEGIENHPPARFTKDGEVLDTVTQEMVNRDREIRAELIAFHEKYWAVLANTDSPKVTEMRLRPVQTRDELDVITQFVEKETLKTIEVGYIVSEVLTGKFGMTITEASEHLPYGYESTRRHKHIYEVPAEVRRTLRSYDPPVNRTYQLSRIFQEDPDALNSNCPKDLEYHPSEILSATIHGASAQEVESLSNKYIEWLERSEEGLTYELYEGDYAEREKEACEAVAFQMQNYLKALPPYVLRAMAYSHSFYSEDEASKRDALTPNQASNPDATKEDLSWTVAISLVESHILRENDIQAGLQKLSEWAEIDGLDIIVPDVDS